MQETIFAQSTPVGIGGIAIVRLSGSESLLALQKIFIPKSKKAMVPKVLTYGTLQYHDEIIDEAMAVYMPAPATYTREDVVEFHCHGSHASVSMLLSALSSIEGLRPAQPGEFTKRAFLNGRLDLSEAEAVMDVISALSSSAQKSAMHQLSGSLSFQIYAIKEKLLNAQAAMEAAVDFPEDIWEEEAIEAGKIGYAKTLQQMQALLATYRGGRVIKEGIRAAIVGRPNVGKSSLLNAIAGFERAIVSDIAGTTRDMIEENITINGQLIRLMDTAGIHEKATGLEQKGIEFSKKILQDADIAIWVLDGAEALQEADLHIAQLLEQMPTIVAINKSDCALLLTEESAKTLAQNIVDVIQISALEQRGIQQLFELVVENTRGKETEMSAITSERHFNELKCAKEATEAALNALEQGLPSDIAALDARRAMQHLGTITGEDASEEVIGEIFAQFCVGK